MPPGAGAVRRCGRILSIPLALAASLTLSTASADAATRYASPTGGAGPSCPQATPCNIQVAVESAANGDEVIVTPGTYVETNQLIPTAVGLNIHGTPGMSKPTIQSNAGGVILNGTDQRIADLRIVYGDFGSALSIYNDAIAERMVVETTTGAAACSPFNGSVLRDSLCIATGGGGAGVAAIATDTTTTGILRNVTAVGTGNAGAGISVGSGGPTVPDSAVTLDVRNTIALAGPLATADIVLSATAGSTATIDLQYSNYDTVSETGAGTTTSDPAGSATNQTALPQLTSEYRELANSPTRNAGSPDSSSGLLDADGAQRVQGIAIDIGAYEFTEAAPPPPPVDTTAPQTTIDKGPKKKTKKRKATFLFSADEAGSSFACKLDRKAFSPCSSPLKMKRLKKGKHTLSVVATDAAGNADATPATYRWKVKKKRRK